MHATKIYIQIYISIVNSQKYYIKTFLFFKDYFVKIRYRSFYITLDARDTVLIKKNIYASTVNSQKYYKKILKDYFVNNIQMYR